MESYQASCVFPARAVLGEGPVWEAQARALDWIDIERRRVCRFDPASRSNREWVLPERVGFAVHTEAGDMLAGTQKGLIRFSQLTGEVSPLEDPEPHLPLNRFNDGKCDPQGRLWAGTMSIEEKPGAGTLYRLDPGGSPRPMLGEVAISNGLAWSADSRTLYYIDSPTRRVDAFDFDPEEGGLSNRRTAVALQDGWGYPDGMAIDAEDKLWVALWEGWGVARFDPGSGELLARIEVPVARVTSCCFGGPGYQDLYITTASRDMEAEEWKRQPEAGGLFVARPGVPGLPAARFRG